MARAMDGPQLVRMRGRLCLCICSFCRVYGESGQRLQVCLEESTGGTPGRASGGFCGSMGVTRGPPGATPSPNNAARSVEPARPCATPMERRVYPPRVYLWYTSGTPQKGISSSGSSA